MICDKCNEPNTEFLSFTKEVKLDTVSDRMNMVVNTSVKRIVSKYVDLLHIENVTTNINICQKCISKGFRSFKKDK